MFTGTDILYSISVNIGGTGPEGALNAHTGGPSVSEAGERHGFVHRRLQFLDGMEVSALVQLTPNHRTMRGAGGEAEGVCCACANEW